MEKEEREQRDKDRDGRKRGGGVEKEQLGNVSCLLLAENWLFSTTSCDCGHRLADPTDSPLPLFDGDITSKQSKGSNFNVFVYTKEYAVSIFMTRNTAPEVSTYGSAMIMNSIMSPTHLSDNLVSIQNSDTQFDIQDVHIPNYTLETTNFTFLAKICSNFMFLLRICSTLGHQPSNGNC